MNVADMMTARPATIHQDESLHQAIEAMGRIGCHHLPVVSNDTHIVGVITEADCRRGLKAATIPPTSPDKEEAARHLLVRNFMSAAPIIVEPDMPADEAARLMLAHHVSCLPVMRSETLIGIITTSDILIAFIRMSKRETVDHL
jgi:acetoin utilization protein AcuB